MQQKPYSATRKTYLRVRLFLCYTLSRIDVTMAWTWTERSPEVMPPFPKRSGHMVFVPPYGQPLIFGGYAEESASNRFVVNDLWRWNHEDGSGCWGLVQATGDIPEPRLVAASAVSGGKAYLFGGWNPSKTTDRPRILDDVHELDLETFVWTKLSCTMPDGPTSRHIAVTLDDGTIVLHTHRCDNYIILFDPNTKSFRKQPTTGPCPSSRGLHAACPWNDTTILLFGGASKDQTMSGETFLLNVVVNNDATSCATFERLEYNDGPSPRAAPCLVTLHEASSASSYHGAILFGGAEMGASSLVPLNDLWLLQKESNHPTWTKIETAILPPPRNAATLVPVSDQEFILTGGWRPFIETHNDCYILTRP